MPIRLKEFDLLGIAGIEGGKLNTLVKHQMARMSQDCMDRPGDKSPRKLLIELQCKPVLSQDGTCEEVHQTFECRHKLPTYRSKTYVMKPTKGGFLFNEDSLDDPNQMAMFDEEA